MKETEVEEEKEEEKEEKEEEEEEDKEEEEAEEQDNNDNLFVNSFSIRVNFFCCLLFLQPVRSRSVQTQNETRRS